MISVKVGIPFLRCETYNQEENHTFQCYKLSLRIALYNRRSKRYFNSKVNERRFKEGNLVLKKILPNTKEVNARVLGGNWEGSYVIAGVL